jgi:hypothetical protein
VEVSSAPVVAAFPIWRAPEGIAEPPLHDDCVCLGSPGGSQASLEGPGRQHRVSTSLWILHIRGPWSVSLMGPARAAQDSNMAPQPLEPEDQLGMGYRGQQAPVDGRFWSTG